MTGTAVVTGIGIAAPNGVGINDHWDATLRGVSGIRPIDRFDARGYPITLAGQIPAFEAEERLPGRLMPQTDRVTRLALVAADLAFADAAVDPKEIPEYLMGVATASTSGGLEFGQRELQKLWGQGWEHVSAYMSFAWYYAVHAGQISIKNGMRGPGGVLVSEQAGGIDAMAFARRQIRKGTTVMATGGLDGTLCPYGMAIQAASRGLSPQRKPELAYLPFDKEASGYVPGEGGAILLVEDGAQARERGAPQIYGAIAGYGAVFDPEPGGADGLRRAARVALADAGLTTADIDVVFADAAGLPESDRAEVDVLDGLFGPRGVPVAAPKTMCGRLLSGGAALDVASALLAMRDDVVPPAVHVREHLVDDRLDLVVGEPRSWHIDAALVLARGHGGFASAVVLTHPDKERSNEN